MKWLKEKLDPFKTEILAQIRKDKTEMQKDMRLMKSKVEESQDTIFETKNDVNEVKADVSELKDKMDKIIGLLEKEYEWTHSVTTDKWNIIIMYNF